MIVENISSSTMSETKSPSPAMHEEIEAVCILLRKLIIMIKKTDECGTSTDLPYFDMGKVDNFLKLLYDGLYSKYQGHWYPENPIRGNAYRVVQFGHHSDKTVCIAAANAGLDIYDVITLFPKDVTVWADPNCVSFRIGDFGHPTIVYGEDYSVSRSSPLSSPTKTSRTPSPEKAISYSPKSICAPRPLPYQMPPTSPVHLEMTTVPVSAYSYENPAQRFIEHDLTPPASPPSYDRDSFCSYEYEEEILPTKYLQSNIQNYLNNSLPVRKCGAGSFKKNFRLNQFGITV